MFYINTVLRISMPQGKLTWSQIQYVIPILCVCVCVCVSLIATIRNNDPLNLQSVTRNGLNNKESKTYSQLKI
jgi:hypothetical protein